MKERWLPVVGFEGLYEVSDLRTRHGRTLRGELAARAKLTARRVLRIRAEYRRGGVRQVDLAAKHGVGQSTVSSLLRGDTWAHV